LPVPGDDKGGEQFDYRNRAALMLHLDAVALPRCGA